MLQKLYDPFETFSFDERHCYLTGKSIELSTEKIPVFPKWLMEEYELYEKPLKMLDESISSYGALTVPACTEVADKINAINIKMKEAFSKGYTGVKELDQWTLFQWIGNWFYGVIFNEIQAGVRASVISGEELNFSQSLVHKFKNLHRMLQSLVSPMEFEYFNPFKVLIWEVDNENETFTYRDEVNTLVFSLRMKNVGIIACLQDSGTNFTYHKEVVEQTISKKLHPMQFEELAARFYYSAYLFNRLPEYTYMITQECVYIEAMPLNDFTQKPIFDHWVNKTYAQVLENFWKPWGITFFEIMKDPENPVTFLFDENGRVISYDKVVLP